MTKLQRRLRRAEALLPPPNPLSEFNYLMPFITDAELDHLADQLEHSHGGRLADSAVDEWIRVLGLAADRHAAAAGEGGGSCP